MREVVFRFKEVEIPGLLLVEGEAIEDDRGVFAEFYKRSEFEGLIPESFVQDNYSYSVCGVLRGLHYQIPPKAQGKFVSVMSGEIFDVAVDIRRGSPSYGRWFGVYLSGRNRRGLYIPRGFAHGFCVLSDEAHVLYKVTAEYEPDLERGICWYDPALGIHWPIKKPLVSIRDSQLPTLTEIDPLKSEGR